MKKISIEDYIIYEDNHIIVLNKPEGILSQEDETHDPDMVNILKDYLKEKYNKPGNVYVGLVHRLDRRVSGVMVFAKTSKAASRLSDAIRNHEFKKVYYALVSGYLTGSKNLIDNIDKNNKKASINELGKESILEYNVLKNIIIDKEQYSLLEIHLFTGRYNQIRMQLSNIGYPIINDFKYGYRGNNYNDHLGLYCVKLSFPHPISKEMLEFKMDERMFMFNEYLNINI